MVSPAVGAIVMVPFPFSDLSQTKMRPAVVLAEVGNNDYILCQITSNPYGDPLAVTITNRSFKNGGLQITSYVRPGKLFTTNSSLLVKQLGHLKGDILKSIIDAVVGIIRAGLKP